MFLRGYEKSPIRFPEMRNVATLDHLEAMIGGFTALFATTCSYPSDVLSRA